MEADLKIAIGCVTAHAQVGFSGGGKIVLPGVSHVDSIAHYHLQVEAMAKETTGLGNFDDNIMRAECDAAGDMAGLDFKVDCLINRRGEIANLHAGPFRETHAAGAEEGKEHGLQVNYLQEQLYAKENTSNHFLSLDQNVWELL